MCTPKHTDKKGRYLIMETVDKFAAMISGTGKKVADKAKILADIAKKKSEISACEETIRKNYMELGKLVYEEYERARDAESGRVAEEAGAVNAAFDDAEQQQIQQVPERYMKQCKIIYNAKKGIAELEKEIQEIKQD